MDIDPLTQRALPSPPPERAASARVARNVFFLMLGQATTMVIGVVYNGSVGRFLGADEFGLFFVLTTFATFAYILVGWGQQRYVIREVARSPQRSGELLAAGMVLRVVATVVACVLGGFVAWTLGYAQRTEWLIVAFIGASLPFWLVELYGTVFRGRERMGLDATVAVTNKAVELVLALGALYAGLGLGGIIVAQAIAGAVALFMATRLYPRVTNVRVEFSKTTAREMLTGGRALAALSVAVCAQSYIEVVLLSKLVPLEVVGWFAAAKTIMGAIFAAVQMVAFAYFPVLSRAAADPIDFRREARNALRPMLWFAGLVGTGTYLFGGTAIKLVYGGVQFGPAADVLRVFGPGLFLFVLGVFFSYTLTALHRERGFVAAKVCSVAVSTVLALILIPYFQRRSGNGGIGAVLAFVLSEFVVVVGSLFLMPRGAVGSALFSDGTRALAAAALTAVLVLVVPMPAWLAVPVCVVVFAVMSWIFGLVRRADIELLAAMVMERPPRSS